MKPRDRALGAGADRPTTMTSSVSVDQHQPPTVSLLAQQQSRRHIERPIRVWPFAMECLAETETETDSPETTDNQPPVEDSSKANASSITPTQKTNSNVAKRDNRQPKKNDTSTIIQQQPDGTKKIVEAEPVGCAPFFGVKHYLHNFYGLPDDNTSAKIWRQIEAVSPFDLV